MNDFVSAAGVQDLNSSYLLFYCEETTCRRITANLKGLLIISLSSPLPLDSASTPHISSGTLALYIYFIRLLEGEEDFHNDMSHVSVP